MKHKIAIGSIISRLIFITLGATIMSFSLEGILIPNHIIDGGITGISMIVSHLTPLGLGMLLFLLNCPFLIIGYKQIGKIFAFSMAYGIISLSVATHLMHNIEPFVQDELLAVVFGGALLGIGVGIVMRNGGVLDGTETLAILIEKRTPFSVGEIIMGFNVVIFSVAAFTFGLNNALYSMLTYYIGFNVIDSVVKGFDDMEIMYVISPKYKEIAHEISEQMGRGVTFINGQGSYSGDEQQVIMSVFTRLEESKVKDIVLGIDDKAFIILNSVSEVKGGRFGTTKK